MYGNIIERYNLVKKIIIYLRKSREEQINGYGSVEFTLERHEEILQTWALNNLGAKIPEEYIFREVGSSETISNRPVMLHVLKMIQNGEVSGVLVIDPQRLSRGDLKDCGELIETLEWTKTKALTPTKIYDLNDKFDKKIFRDELLRGNEYLEYTKEILSRGRHLSVSQGKFVGSKPPYGFDKEKLHNEKGFKLVPNKDSETVKLIFSMFIEGSTPHKIASYLRNIGANKRTTKDWTQGSVKQILLNPVYYGFQTWENRKTTKIFVDGKIKTVRLKNEDVKFYKALHDPLISQEDFVKVQEMLENRSVPKTISSLETQNPLAGIVKCNKCKRSMVRQSHYGEFITRRKFPFDKYEFQDFIKKYKTKNNISHKEIYESLQIPKHYVYGWFGKPDKFFVSDMFLENWLKLKKILNINSNKYDKPLTEFEQVQKPETLACIYHSCNNTSSHLHLVEEKLLKVVASRLDNYKHFLDNYEMEHIKEVENNEKIIKSIDKKIAGLNVELMNALRNYNREDYTRDQYLSLKSQIEAELKQLEKEKSSLLVNKEDEVLVIKKSVPILQSCIDNYNMLHPKDKNKLLKTIFNTVYYAKSRKGSEFEILPEFKI